MPRYVIKLKFTAPLHIGKPGIGVENCLSFIPSDTLFSALIHSWALSYGKEEVDKLIKSFIGRKNPPFRISSAFLYREKDRETVYYLPQPCLDLDSLSQETFGETLKGMDFIPHYFFNQWVARDFGLSPIDNNKDKIEELESYKRLYEESLSSYLNPRNELDRLSLTSTIYWVGLVSFDEEAGLYFFLEIEEENYKQFRKVLSFLGERGLGGERSLGCGQFEVKDEEKYFLEEPKASESNKLYCSLSLVHPREEEIEKARNYTLMRRTGFIDSPFLAETHKKLPCPMFAEGSVFKEPIKGKLVEVTPESLKKANGQPRAHPIYRSGLSFMIGARRR